MVEELEGRLLLSTFIVNSNDDTDDGTCDAAHCSLREAINAANSAGGADTIAFGIPGSNVPTIRPTSPLPTITDPVTLDGSTQSAGKVELDGSLAGLDANGLEVTAGSSTVHGLVINRFDVAGILLRANGGNVIEGNLIGTDSVGTTDLGNGADGILILGVANNTIGGTATGAGNVISGNELNGVEIRGANASANLLQGNFIGTDVTGTRGLANGFVGVLIDGAPSNTVGGTSDAARNVISGNDTHGIRIYRSGAAGNVIQGNLIGTDVTGTEDLGNGSYGVLVDGAPNNMIGGTSVTARNIVSGNEFGGMLLYRSGASGNRVLGNFIGTDLTGAQRLGNGGQGIFVFGAPGNLIGDGTPAGRNVISANESNGVFLVNSGAKENRVQGNYIGTDATGAIDLGNAGDGVRINDASSNIVGGTESGAGNLISGNDSNGVEIGDPFATANRIEGNLIGTDATGTAALANRFSGVFLNGVHDNVVGGPEAGARNVLSGNGTSGVAIQSGAARNIIQGNFIGTDISGKLKLGNTFNGIYLVDATENTIGGTDAGTGNVISANGVDGVQIFGDGATGNQVLGNLIGTDRSGTAALGNKSAGVFILGASGNMIGGPTAEARNIISGNLFGVFFSGAASNNLVQGNYIGTDITGSATLGNLDGVVLVSPSNTIGGTVAGAGNVISGNENAGVEISATGNTIQGNFIGTDASGLAALGNGEGVFVGGGQNTIGGSSAGAGNVISANASDGIFIVGGASQNVIQGNLIGTDRTGMAALGNWASGVEIRDSGANMIGGTTPGAGNVISGNGSHGVAITGFDSDQDMIQGNLIGTDVTGKSAVPNSGAGVSIDDTGGVTVGGTDAGARNVISGNTGSGVLVSDVFGFLNDTIVVAANFIGTDRSGKSPLGNGDSGVRIEFSFAVTIGGEDAGAGNVIAFNGGVGVMVFPTPGRELGGFGNSILSNSIFSNTGLGIDLGDDGVTSNGQADGDLNRSDHPNFPVLRSATAGAPAVVRGTLTSTPRTQFLLQFFANTELDPTRFGEGERFVGSANVRTNSRGVAVFRISPASPIKLGEFVTATATNPDGDTSEFSRGIIARLPRATVAGGPGQQATARTVPGAALTPSLAGSGIIPDSQRPESLTGWAGEERQAVDLKHFRHPHAALTRGRVERADRLVDLVLAEPARGLVI